MARARLVRRLVRPALVTGIGTLLCLTAPSSAFAAGPARAYDFNGDGHDDLAIGVPGESVGSTDFAGAAAVLYSNGSGLSTAGSQLWSQDSDGVHGTAEFGDRFASVVTSADFNGDGRADHAVGDPGETIGSKIEAGAVNVVYGSKTGLTSTHNQLWSQSTKGVPYSAKAGVRFGASIASGDFDGDGYADLVIGVPQQGIKGTESAGGIGTGMVTVLYGSKTGLTSKRAQTWTQNSKGIKGSTEFNDEFGNALASADVDGDGYADLAVGVHYENDQAGAVALIRGSKKGLTSKGNQLWSQSSPGMRDKEEPSDLFGESLAFGDYNHDGHADLAVGVPGEVVQACANPDPEAECDDQGAVQVLLGTTKGLTATGNQLFHIGDAGIPGTVTDVNSFGDRLTSGDFNGDGAADLAITAPTATVGTVFGGGTVYVLNGSRNGLRANGFRLTQATPGVPGDPESVGGSDMNVASRRFSGAYDSLVVGMPGVTVDGQDTAGEVLVVPGSAGGLAPAGTKVLTQDTAGLADDPEDRDRFGEVSGGLER